MDIEIEIDEGRTLLLANISAEDTSFDHAFGTKKQSDSVLKDFTIITYIENIDHDVTESIRKNSPKIFELYKEQLQNHLIAKGA